MAQATLSCCPVIKILETLHLKIVIFNKKSCLHNLVYQKVEHMGAVGSPKCQFFKLNNLMHSCLSGLKKT